MVYVLYSDLELCLGCKSCEIACAVEHSEGKDLVSAIEESVRPRIDVVYVGVPVPVTCMHCNEAPCIEVCPTHAIHKRDGAVVVDRSKCVGCKACAIVCPHGAIFVGKVAEKCDLCMDRMERGSKPACVEACPVGALRIEKLEDLVERKKIETAKGFLKEREEIRDRSPFKDLIWIVRW